MGWSAPGVAEVDADDAGHGEEGVAAGELLNKRSSPLTSEFSIRNT
jgi:hypothetical protein